MKIGLISSSDDNPYACCLLARLLREGVKPSLVLCTHSSKLARGWAVIRREGWGWLIRRVMKGRSPGGLGQSLLPKVLADYAAKHGLGRYSRNLREACIRQGIDYVRVPSVNDPQAANAVRERDMDLMLSVVGEIYRTPMIQAPRVGLLNVHMAFLPDFRGMNVLEWSALADRPIGVTAHFVVEKIDAGDIVCSQAIPIASGDGVAQLRAKAIVVNVDVMLDAVRRLQEDPTGNRRPGSDEGKQYFVMHPRLRAAADRKIHQLSQRVG